MTDRRPLLWTGLAGAVIGVAATLLATLLSPTFTWAGSALSDLGAADAATPWLFNGGLMAAGLVALPFAWVLVSSARNEVERLGAIAYAGAIVALALVGAFPTGTALHFPVAVGYFALLTVALWIHGSGAVLAGDAGRGLAAIWLGILHVLQWLVWAAEVRVGQGLAIPELIGSFIPIAWLVQTTLWVRERDAS